MTCQDCAGARSVPADVRGGYAPCSCCVIDARETFLCCETKENTEPET